MLEMGPNTTTQKQNKEFPEWDQHVFQSVLFKTSIIPLIQAKYRPLSFDQIQLVNTKIQQYSVYLCPHFWNWLLKCKIPILKMVILNGAFGVMVKDIKIEIKAKNFNRNFFFLTLQCIECIISKNILPFLYP
jgi:hypothetical protein